MVLTSKVDVRRCLRVPAYFSPRSINRNESSHSPFFSEAKLGPSMLREKRGGGKREEFTVPYVLLV